MRLFLAACLVFTVLSVTAVSVTDDAVHPNVTRLTGLDMEPCKQWQVCGTDLGIPFLLENGSVGYLFGDTFDTRNPEHTTRRGWRSPVMLRSSSWPSTHSAITFDSAAGIRTTGTAPSIIYNGKNTGGEFTVIPNDGVSFPEKNLQVISYQSVRRWGGPGGSWHTNYSGLAWSLDGNRFERSGPIWPNNPGNTDPFQMVSMQRDGDFVYAISVRAGRQQGPMMLQRAPWDKVLVRSAWKCWNGEEWGRDCRAVINGRIGEPSLRKLRDGTWAMSYLNAGNGSIVTRTAAGPTGPWSSEQRQLAWWQLPNLYGGFIHPYSTRHNLTLMISTWQREENGKTSRYDVMQLNSNLRTPVITRD